MRMLLILGSIAATFGAVPAAALLRAPDASLLVSTSWLAERLEQRGVVILWTAQGGRSEEVIPGTRAVPHESLMTMEGAHDLALTGAIVEALEGAGVSNDSHVIVYGEPMSAGWLFFALEYLGHERVSMLDGGIDKWRAEGRPVSPATPSPTRGSFSPTLRPQLKATADEVKAQLDTGRAVLLDARSSMEYDAGRIPGAKLASWQDVYADPNLQVFKSREALAAYFQAAGAVSGVAAITYCQVGMRSSVLYFAARYAGLSVSNYVGSWSDWRGRDLPAERPDQR